MTEITNIDISASNLLLLSKSVNDRTSLPLNLLISRFGTILVNNSSIRINDDDDDDDDETLKITAQTLRNAAAYLPNAICFSNFGDSADGESTFLHNIQRFLQLKVLGTSSSPTALQSSQDGIISNICEMIANMTAHGNEALNCKLWTNHSFLFCDMVVISSKIHSRRAFAATLASIYNTICTKNTVQPLSTLCTSRQLMCQILLNTIVISSKGHNSPDPAQEWIKRILQKCVHSARLIELYRLLQPRCVSAEGGVFDLISGSPMNQELPWTKSLIEEQIIFLRVLQSVLEDDASAEVPLPEAVFSRDSDLSDLLLTLAHTSTYILNHICSSSVSSSTAASGSDRFSNDLAEAGLLSVLSVLGAALGHDCMGSGLGHPLKKVLTDSTEIFSVCTSILAAGLPGASTKQPLLFSCAEAKNDTIRGALRLLGNLCYRCPDAQDAFRTHDGFAAVLRRCATNFDNPFEREWALICIRNACEGNRANQEYVESLQPQGAKVLDEQAGVEIDINPSSGTFRFKNVSA